MRVYVPLTLSGLAEAHRTGELGPGPLDAYAVTPALREWYVSDDIEELEYAALSRAALASLRLLAADPGAPRRRVVVAVDVPDGAARRRSRPGARPGRAGRGADGRRRAAGRGGGGARGRRRRRGGRRGRGRRAGRGRPRATTTRSSPSTAPRTTSCSGTPPRRSPTCWADLRVCRMSVAAGTFSGHGDAHGAHIVWDWNGTLFHDIDAVIGATNAAFAELGLEPITLERYRELYCVPVPKFYERLMGRLPTDAEWEVMDETFHRHYSEHRVRLRARRGRAGAARGVAGGRAAASRSSACTGTRTWSRWCGRFGIEPHFLRVDGRTGPSGGSKAEHMVRHLGRAGAGVDPRAYGGDRGRGRRRAGRRHVGARAVLYTGGSHSRASLEAAGVPVVDTLGEAVVEAERLAAGLTDEAGRAACWRRSRARPAPGMRARAVSRPSGPGSRAPSPATRSPRARSLRYGEAHCAECQSSCPRFVHIRLMTGAPGRAIAWWRDQRDSSRGHRRPCRAPGEHGRHP